MDGNRRYAKKNNLPTLEGHRKGYEKIGEVLDWASDEKVGIKNVILYAFSTENWNRSKSEVSYLMDLFKMILTKEIKKLKTKGVRIKHIGEIDRFSPEIQNLLKKAEEDTKEQEKITLVLALSYGGRAEILGALKKISKEKTPSEIEKMSENDFSLYLQTRDIPDPDIIVRTSGEMRLSNFLPWQSVYSELFFVPVFWPEFSRKDFDSILDEYASRHRRMGK